MQTRSSRLRNHPAVLLSEALKKWEKIIPVHIAKSVFQCVKGSADQLCVDPQASVSVWGKVVKILGLENTALNRLWVSAAYHSNTDIRVIHQDLCKQHKKKFISIIEPSADTRVCICQNAEKPNGNPFYSMVKCSSCLDWYHGVCVGIQTELYDDDPYKCPRCEGIPDKQIAPPIFLPLPQKAPRKKISLESSGEGHSLDIPDETLQTSNVLPDISVSQFTPDATERSPRQIWQTSAILDRTCSNQDVSNTSPPLPSVLPQPTKKQFKFKKPFSTSSSGAIDKVKLKPPTRTSAQPHVDEEAFLPEQVSEETKRPGFHAGDDRNIGSLPRGERGVRGTSHKIGFGSSSPLSIKSGGIQPEPLGFPESRADLHYTTSRRSPILRDHFGIDELMTHGSEQVKRPPVGRTFGGFPRYTRQPNLCQDKGESVRVARLGDQRLEIANTSFSVPRLARFTGSSDIIGNPKQNSEIRSNQDVIVAEERRETMRHRKAATNVDQNEDEDLNSGNEDMGPLDDENLHNSDDDNVSGRMHQSLLPLQTGYVSTTRTNLAVDAQPSVTESIDGIEGPVTGFKPFFITIPKAEYKKIANRIPKLNVIDKRYSWRFDSKIWPHLFYTVFLHQCPDELKGCCVNWRDHRFPAERGGKIFCEVLGYCNRKGSVECSMKYKLHIIDEPMVNQDVTARVTPEGTLHHDLALITKRNLAGLRRQEAKDKLKTLSAGLVRRELQGNSDTEKVALDKANYSEVQTIPVLRKAKQEVMGEGDLDKDPYRDLEKRAELFDQMPHLQGRHFKGFIQLLARRPFHVGFYCERQLDLLKKYLKYDPAGVLHIDSTGNVTGRLAPELGGTTSFYYAVVIQLPGSIESPCVPVMEFITNVNSATKISHLLHYFFRLYGEKFGSKEYGFGLRRIETDCSRALISAIHQALEIGRTERYLRDTWYHLTKNKPIYFVHHICRTHAVNFTNKHIDENFKGEDQKLIRIWRDYFLFGKSLEDFCRRSRDIGCLCGKKYMTNDVKEVIAKLRDPTDDQGYKPWSSSHLEDLPSTGPFYSSSPYGNYVLKLFYDMKIPLSQPFYDAIDVKLDDIDDEDDIESSFQENSKFSIKFLEYLIKWVLCLGPMFDHSLLTLNSYSINVDTNSASEAWNKLLKKDEMVFGLNMKIGRFAAFAEEILRGRLEMFEHGLQRKQREKGAALCRQRVTQQQVNQGDLNEDFESSQEQWRRKNPRPSTSSILPTFVSYLVLNAKIEIQMGPKIVNLNSIINFQNPLQILYTLFKCNQRVNDYMQNSTMRLNSDTFEKITNIFKDIDSGNYNNAVSFCLDEVMYKDIAYLNSDDIFMGERNFIRALGELFPVVEVSDCRKDCFMSNAREIYPMRDFVVSSSSPLRKILTSALQTCEFCLQKNSLLRYTWSSTGAIPLIAYAVDFRTYQLQEIDLPNSISICGSRFELYAYTSETNKSFSTVYFNNRKKYMYSPGKDIQVVKALPSGYDISSVWFVRSENDE